MENSKQKTTKGPAGQQPEPAPQPQTNTIDLPTAELMQMAGYKRLFRFAPAIQFKEVDMPFTPGVGEHLIYGQTHYSVSKVSHNIDTQETRVYCQRTHY